MVRIWVTDTDGSVRELNGAAGESMLDLARTFDLDIEGTCGGQMACATCHCVVAPEDFAKLPAASDEEREMLEFARSVEPTSRLGCQIKLGPTLDGMRVRVIGE